MIHCFFVELFVICFPCLRVSGEANTLICVLSIPYHIYYNNVSHFSFCCHLHIKPWWNTVLCWCDMIEMQWWSQGASSICRHHLSTCEGVLLAKEWEGQHFSTTFQNEVSFFFCWRSFCLFVLTLRRNKRSCWLTAPQPGLKTRWDLSKSRVARVSRGPSLAWPESRVAGSCVARVSRGPSQVWALKFGTLMDRQP